MNPSELNELRDKIDQHLGKRILGALEEYAVSKEIFRLNTSQLRHIIQVLEDPAGATRLLPLANRPMLGALIQSAVQHFHNFLASITTLIDHTRHLMNNDFISEAHRDEFHQTVQAEFATDPLARFMKDFRNYITHREVPMMAHVSDLLANVSTFRVNVEKMLASDFRWTAPAKQFMESHRPDVRILTLINDYEAKAKALHDRMAPAFTRYYKEPIEEFLTLNQRFNDETGMTDVLRQEGLL